MSTHIKYMAIIIVIVFQNRCSEKINKQEKYHKNVLIQQDVKNVLFMEAISNLDDFDFTSLHSPRSLLSSTQS